MQTNYELIDNVDSKRYEFQIGEYRPRLEYIKAANKIFLTHTEVPKDLAGKGIGSALIKAVLEEVEKLGLTLVPLCPFVALYIQRNPEWRKLVMKGINITE